MPLLLGIDVGTSSTKALVCDESGAVLRSGTASYPMHVPHAGWSEQNPADWWHATVQAIRQAISGVDRSGIRGIGLSGQMHGLVLLDRTTVASGGVSDAVLGPAILWNDQRTAHECHQIEETVGGRAVVVRLVGNAALPGFTLPKILWTRIHEPDRLNRSAAMLLPKDYVRFRMTGLTATDFGDASGTLLFDVDRRCWADRVASRFDIDLSLLPRVHESGAVAGELTDWSAGELGLRPGIPVVAGSGDNMCGAVGAGIVRSGMVLATIGTSGVIYAHSDRPRRDLGNPATPGRVHTMCAATGRADAPGGWCLTGCTLSAGGSLQWARDALWPDATIAELLAESESAPLACEGLSFLPYLTGERCPHPDPFARGAWIGLSARHERRHLVRAILEGVASTMAQILDLMREVGIDVSSIRLGGGGARSALWRQMHADAFGTPVATTNTEEGPALGAALLAGVCAGVWKGIEEACDATISEQATVVPHSDGVAAFHEISRMQLALYGDLRDRFPEMSASHGPE